MLALHSTIHCTVLLIQFSIVFVICVNMIVLLFILIVVCYSYIVIDNMSMLIIVYCINIFDVRCNTLYN